MSATAGTRAHIATVVVAGPAGRLVDASAHLRSVDQAGGMRTVFLATEAADVPQFADMPDAVAIGGLNPQFLNNAIAALRLSSLPTVVWWRGGDPKGLDGVAALADRVVLDADDVMPLWRRARGLFEQTALTDIRWPRLTRWRAVMAHFFDLPQVQRASDGLQRLAITGADRAQALLLAGWLDASLGWRGRVEIAIQPGRLEAPLESIELAGERAALSLRLLPNSTCLETEARVDGHGLAAGVFSLGDQRLPTFLAEELRVRSRDTAFERAVQSVLAMEPKV